MSEQIKKHVLPVASLKGEILWGQQSIAEFLGGGKSVDFVIKLRQLDDVPIHKVAGSVYAFKSDLARYFRDPDNYHKKTP